MQRKLNWCSFAEGFLRLKWKQLDLLNDFAEGINWTCSVILKCLGSNQSVHKSNVVFIFNCFISVIFSYIFLS